MSVLQTERLELRELVADDAEFIFGLVNQPSWLQFIGDKGVRNLDDARAYIANGPAAMIAKHGHGLYAVSLRGGELIGICGLIQRDTLPDPDIGFAFLPQFGGAGYAQEAAAATLELGKSRFGMRRIVAITNPHNQRSIRLLEKIGLHFEERRRLSADADEVAVFAWQAE